VAIWIDTVACECIRNGVRHTVIGRLGWRKVDGRVVRFVQVCPHNMNHQQATRFARTLLDNNCDEPIFEVAVDPVDREHVIKALVELGCDVSVQETKSWLTVTCPEGELQHATGRKRN
jgi:hypothetical protein